MYGGTPAVCEIIHKHPSQSVNVYINTYNFDKPLYIILSLSQKEAELNSLRKIIFYVKWSIKFTEEKSISLWLID